MICNGDVVLTVDTERLKLNWTVGTDILNQKKKRCHNVYGYCTIALLYMVHSLNLSIYREWPCGDTNYIMECC